MSMTKELLAALMLLAALFSGSHNAFAWGSDVHTSLIQFTPMLQNVPGVMRSNPRYVKPKSMAHLCDRQRQKLRPNSVYYELLCGADEPDAKRKWFYAISHQADAAKRARRAFACSIHNRLKRGRAGWPDWKAARQLGHSIHYLQDLADPSKRAGRHKTDIRRQARGVMGWVLDRAGVRFPELPFALRRRVQQARSMMSGLNSPEEIVARARRVQRETAPVLISAYEAFSDATSEAKNAKARDYNGAILDTLALTIALQERWVDLYVTGLARAHRNRNYWRATCRGATLKPPPPPPSCPRPPATASLAFGNLFEIAVMPYGPGLKCLTAQQAQTAQTQPGVTHFKGPGAACPICPAGYGPVALNGAQVCARCPRGTRYSNGCCR